MLAVTANWAVSDGSLASPRADLACAWLETVRVAAIRAGCGPDGRYRPIEKVTLVFAGDTLDLLLTDLWTGRDRPWHGGRRGRAAQHQALAAALRAARSLFGKLRNWVRHGLVVPAADGRGRPAEGIRHRSAVDVVLLVGDRDGALGELASQAARIGFQVGNAWSDGLHKICHGHEFDPLRPPPVPADRLPSQGSRPTLAESLTVELLVPFAVTVRGEPAVWRNLRSMITRLQTACPETVPGIITATVARLDSPHRRFVTTAWRRCVEDWFEAARREPPVHEAEFDAAAALAAWFDSIATETDLLRPPPPSVRRLAAVPPPGLPGSTTLLGHLPGGLTTGRGVIGLGDEFPRLFVQSGRAAPVNLAWLGPQPTTSGIVRVGETAAGSGIVDAA